MSRIAIFPGSFDPFTKGHLDIAIRGSKLFDHLIIGIGYNTKKNRYFQVEMMAEKIEEVIKPHASNVSVAAYQGLTAEFAKEKSARFILRGVRNTTDFEYENSIAEANKRLNAELETVFLITTPELAHISSTITREIHKFGKDVSDFVPYVL